MDLFRAPTDWWSWARGPALLDHHTRALWTARTDGEDEAPPRRIIHSRALRFRAPARVDRLGIRLGATYLKCVSGPDKDWAADFRVLVPSGDGWAVVLEERGCARPDEGETIWFDLGGASPPMIAVEIRRSGVDGWWPSWNLATTGLVLEGEVSNDVPVPNDTTLAVEGVELVGLPDGVEATRLGGQVRYRTRFLEVGFRLRTASTAYISLDGDGAGRTYRNLLQVARFFDFVPGGGAYPVLRSPFYDYLAQGARLTTIDGRRPLGFLAFDFKGAARVRGNTVEYEVEVPELGQRYELRWTVLEDRLALEATRQGDGPLRAWSSSAWHLATDITATPSTVLGRITREGETGLVATPLVWHAPRLGSLRVCATGDVLCRGDVVRPINTNTFELKVGERPQPEGDYLLEAGTHRAEVEMRVANPELVELRDDAPEAVREAVRRFAITALPYRVDTATLSNNGASMHWPGSLDWWGSLATRLDPVADGLHPTDLLLDSIERWLDGAPGYMSGMTDEGYLMEDDYTVVGPNALLGVARYLDRSRDTAWLDAHAEQIGEQLSLLRARDLDGDGLIEAKTRFGISGQHQESSSMDVYAAGWKDAYVNAMLYPALRLLAEVLPALGHDELAEGLDGWASLVRANYHPAFYNPSSGWYAGWRSKDGELHDYAFPWVVGAAVAYGVVPDDLARDMVARMWAELARVGFDDFRLGLPVNIWRVAEEDITEAIFGLPMGCYAQGGATHFWAGYFVEALYAVGMEAEADRVLEELCAGMVDGTAIDDPGSGVDWKMWDGTPTGYEGQVAEQFSVLVPAIERYRRG